MAMMMLPFRWPTLQRWLRLLLLRMIRCCRASRSAQSGRQPRSTKQLLEMLQTKKNGSASWQTAPVAGCVGSSPMALSFKATSGRPTPSAAF